MPTSVTTIATISDKFSKLIYKNNYEHLLCNLMNASQKVFPGQYKQNTDQSCGQSDFVEIGTETKFEAKLPFRCIHGKLIGSDHKDFGKWLELVSEETTQFGKDLIATRGRNIESLELYKTIEKRLNSIEPDEHAIFFFPYPVVWDGEELTILHMTSDFLDTIFWKLEEKEKIGSRNIYVIYPALDGQIVLRCLNNRTREFLCCSEFDEFVTYNLNP